MTAGNLASHCVVRELSPPPKEWSFIYCLSLTQAEAFT